MEGAYVERVNFEPVMGRLDKLIDEVFDKEQKCVLLKRKYRLKHKFGSFFNRLVHG